MEEEKFQETMCKRAFARPCDAADADYENIFFGPNLFYKFITNSVSPKTEVIIPARTLAELNRLIGDQEETIDITLNPTKSQVLFRLKSVELVSQLVQGTFPNYSQLIPKSYLAAPSRKPRPTSPRFSTTELAVSQ